MTLIILGFLFLWFFVGNLFGISSYIWDMGHCPSRRAVFVFGLIGPVSIMVFIGIACEKISTSAWWNKPIC